MSTAGWSAGPRSMRGNSWRWPGRSIDERDSMLETVVLILHMLVAAGIIGLVLLQHGRGADMGAAFGSGASGTLFGATGSANFLSRTTAVLAAVFFLSSVALTYFGGTREVAQGVIQPTTKSAPAPAAPAPGRASDVPPLPAGGGPAAPAAVPSPPAAAPGAAPATAPATGGQTTGSKSEEVPK